MNFKLKELDAEWKLWLQEDWGDHSLKLEYSAADTENIFETYWHLSPGRKPRELIFSSKRKRGKAKRIWYCEIYFAIRGLWNDSDVVFFITNGMNWHFENEKKRIIKCICMTIVMKSWCYCYILMTMRAGVDTLKNKRREL